MITQPTSTCLEVIHTRPRYQDGVHVRKDAFAQAAGDVVRHAFRDVGSPGPAPFQVRIEFVAGSGTQILHAAKLVVDALVAERVLPSDRVSHLPVIVMQRSVQDAGLGHLIEIVSLEDGGTLRHHVDFDARAWRPPAAALGEDATYAEACRRYGRAVDEAARVLGKTDVLPTLLEAGSRARLAIDVSTPNRNLDLDNVGLFVVDALTSVGSGTQHPTPTDAVVEEIRLSWSQGSTNIRIEASAS